MQKTTEKLHMMGKRFYRRSPSGQCRSDQERRGKPCPGKYQHLHPRHQRRNTAASAGSKRHIDLDRFRLRFGEHTGLPRHSGDRRTAGIYRRHHSRELWPRQRTGRCRRSCKSHCRRAAKISRPRLTGGSYPIVSYDPQKRAAADAQTGHRQRLFVLLHVHLGQRSDGQKSCLRSPPVLTDVKTILPPPPTAPKRAILPLTRGTGRHDRTSARRDRTASPPRRDNAPPRAGCFSARRRGGRARAFSSGTGRGCPVSAARRRS